MNRILISILVFVFLGCVTTADAQRRLTGPQRGGSSGAGDPLRTPTAGGGGAAGPVYTDCSNIGTAQFMWNGEHTSGNTYGCKNSTTTLNGTATGAEIVDSDTDPGVASPTSGNNVVKVDTTDDRLVFSVTSKDIFDSSEGRWCGDVYAAATTGNNYLFRAVVDANNVITIMLTAANVVQVQSIGQDGGATSTVNVNSVATITDATWTTICGRWSVLNNKVSVKVGANNWEDDADADTVKKFTTEPATVRMMGGSTETNSVYIDNVFVWTTSGL